jgi:hypothetical protein
LSAFIPPYFSNLDSLHGTPSSAPRRAARGGGHLRYPEGHAVRLDEQGEVIGITVVNAKWLLGREGKITITVPSLIEPNADELAAVLAAG